MISIHASKSKPSGTADTAIAGHGLTSTRASITCKSHPFKLSSNVLHLEKYALESSQMKFLLCSARTFLGARQIKARDSPRLAPKQRLCWKNWHLKSYLTGSTGLGWAGLQNKKRRESLRDDVAMTQQATKNIQVLGLFYFTR